MADVIRRGFARLADDVDIPEPDLADLVSEGEGLTLEFKSSARFNVHTQARDAELEWVVAKTVAGFANTHGGTLLIGVNDDGRPVGLDEDLRLVGKPDVDRYELWLRDLLERSLGRVAASGIAVTFPTLHGTVVCRVDVPAAGLPVYANRPKGEKTDEFYVRSGNSTRRLTLQEAMEYVQERGVAAPV